MSHEPQVVAVVVTWNRCDLLRESLTGVLAQTRPADRLIVVDNASTDGTAAMLRREFGAVPVVRTKSNVGGAGGFALGLSTALTADADLVWLMDDDTLPRDDTLETMLAVLRDYPDPQPPSLVASRVVWTDGRDHPMNTPRPKPAAGRAERSAAEAVACVPIRSASFVSVLVDAALVRQRGLPVADYFLWNDDFEFTTRLIRGRRGVYCPRAVVVHKTKTFGSTDADPGERFFYEVRNKVWMFTRSRSLAPAEKLLYGASTARRWLRTLRGSDDKATLRRGLRRGLAAGLRAGPRPTQAVLDEATGRHDG